MKILVLDDDPLVAEGLERALRREGYQVAVAHSAADAVKLAGAELLDLVIADVRMPEVDGLEALAMLNDLQEGVRSIVITGYASEDAPVRAIKRGVDDYLFKPVALQDLLKSVRHSLEISRVERENRQALEILRQCYLELVIAVVSAFQNQDPHFFEHSRRVAALAVELGIELGLDSLALDRLELASWLHDLGLLHIEREVLSKADRLTGDELKVLRSHPFLAGQMLEKVPDLRDLVPILKSFREHYDGSGYPAGLKADQIPVEARVLAVAEAFDSLTHDRPHREALPLEQALDELRGQAGKQFDAHIVTVCCDLAHRQRQLADPGKLLERERKALSARERFRRVLELGNLFRQGRQFESAAFAYQEAEKLVETAGSGCHAFLLAEQAHLALCRGQEEETLRLLGRVRQEAGNVQNEAERSRLLEKMAQVLVEAGRPNQAVGLAKEALALIENSPGERMAVTGLRGMLARLAALVPEGQPLFPQLFQQWRQSHPAAYLEGLPPRPRREALDLDGEEAKRGLPGEEAREALERLTRDLRALARVAEEAIPGLNLLAREPAAGGSASPAPPPAHELQIQLLGRMQVIYQERAVADTAWCARKAQELLAYMLVSGPTVPVDRLAEVLWPETGTREQVHTTAYRMRQGLKSVGFLTRWVRNERNFYVIDPDVPYWLDVREFEARATRVKPGPDGVLSEEDLVKVEQALEYYRGDFMDGFLENWILETRARLRERFFTLLRYEAAHWMARDDHERARQAYQKMLEQDLCLEEAHFGLMRSHAAQGQRELAARRYQDYCRVLQAELGLTPSPEVTAFYQQLA